MARIQPYSISVLALAPNYDTPLLTLNDDIYGSDRDITEYQKPIKELSSDDSKLNRFKSRLNILRNLSPNWDGNNAVEISDRVIENTLSFISNLPDFNLIKIPESCLIPSPYGTIFIELFDEKTDFVIEISESELSYFIERQDGTTFDHGSSLIEGEFIIEHEESEIYPSLTRAFSLIELG